jgi:hypothetical protein
MADHTQQPLAVLGIGFTQVFQVNDHKLIAIDQTDITVIDLSIDNAWVSARISWDGFKDLEFDGSTLKGLAYSPDIDVWKPFSFDHVTYHITGGTWPFQEREKPSRISW